MRPDPSNLLCIDLMFQPVAFFGTLEILDIV